MSQPYVGEMRIFAFGRTPNGWAACDGSLLSIAEYEVLYTLLGTVYGGDGVSTFGVPDLRGRVPIHQGQGPGLSSYVIGQKAGVESVTLTSQQMPAHNHAAFATTAAATSGSVGTSLLPGTVSGETVYVSDTSGAVPFGLALQSVTPAGGNQAHTNLMPTLTMQWCIAWAGVFPSQS